MKEEKEPIEVEAVILPALREEMTTTQISKLGEMTPLEGKPTTEMALLEKKRPGYLNPTAGMPFYAAKVLAPLYLKTPRDWLSELPTEATKGRKGVMYITIGRMEDLLHEAFGGKIEEVFEEEKILWLDKEEVLLQCTWRILFLIKTPTGIVQKQKLIRGVGGAQIKAKKTKFSGKEPAFKVSRSRAFKDAVIKCLHLFGDVQRQADHVIATAEKIKNKDKKMSQDGMAVAIKEMLIDLGYGNSEDMRNYIIGYIKKGKKKYEKEGHFKETNLDDPNIWEQLNWIESKIVYQHTLKDYNKQVETRESGNPTADEDLF